MGCCRLNLVLGGEVISAVQFGQYGGGYGEQEYTGQAKKLAACKDAQEGGYGGQAHLMADDFGLQGLADHCYEQIPMARLPEPVVQAMNAQGRSTVPVPRTGRISTSEVMQASVNPAGMPSTRKPI